VTPARTSLLLRPDRCRFALGISVSGSCRKLRAALVAANGQALDMRLELATALVRDVPRRLTRRFRHYAKRGPKKPGLAAVLSAEIAELEAMIVDEICSQAPHIAPRLLVVGVTDPGFWARSRSGLTGYVPLSDAARLADLTGLNVIDAFPARDVAQEGRGGPLAALPDWLLFHHASKTRVLVDFGPTTRVSYLPGARDAAGAERVSTFVAGPGMDLLDRLARRLTAGRERFDAGGHLAVQGQRLADCLDGWLAEASAAKIQTRTWRPAEARVGPLLKSALEKAPANNWSVQDLLCTATHLVAETAARAIAVRLPAEPGIDEVIVTGGGQHNGLLMRELAARLAPLTIVCEAALGLPEDARDPAIAATLALLHLDQTPACPTGITGAQTPRVLGRLTPGSPQVWQRLMRALASGAPSVVSLRSAI
jgi:anhydro-N-acetylmuramic acid kinase